MQQRIIQTALVQEPCFWAHFPEALERPGRHLRETVGKHDKDQQVKICHLSSPKQLSMDQFRLKAIGAVYEEWLSFWPRSSGGGSHFSTQTKNTAGVPWPWGYPKIDGL